MTAPDLRLIPCPACGGDRGWAVPVDVCRHTGGVIEAWEGCTYCDATGAVEVVVEPISEEEVWPC